MKKKEWEKPKLIILTRGKPEEMCLLGCKAGAGEFGAGGGAWWCAGPPTVCEVCEAIGTS